jgi:hypothetical protein
MQRCPYSVKCTGATWRISGDVCHIYIILLCRYANHVCISHTARTNYGDECDLPPTINTPSIFGKSFLFGEERIGPAYCHDLSYAYA